MDILDSPSIAHDPFHYVLAEQFCSSKKFSFKSLHFKNPIRPTLVNVLQIGKIRLFVLLLMFYRFEWPSFALYQNVLQIRVARFCPLTKCSTDPTALTPIFLPLVKCSTDPCAPCFCLDQIFHRAFVVWERALRDADREWTCEVWSSSTQHTRPLIMILRMNFALLAKSCNENLRENW